MVVDLRITYVSRMVTMVPFVLSQLDPEVTLTDKVGPGNSFGQDGV